MKKLLSISAIALLSGISNNVMAQAFTETFQSGIPTNWLTINDANTPSSTLLSSSAVTKMTASGWDISVTKGTSDQCAFSISAFTPSATADRWLITHAFTVSSGMYLTWEDFSVTSPTDSIEVWVAPNGGTTVTSFTTKLYAGAAPYYGTTGTYANSHGVSLSSYVGQSIRVAFREHTTNKLLVYVDNVSAQVLPANDLALTSISPDATSPLTYNTVGNGYQITGTVQNNGASTITSYAVKYQVGSNTPVSQTFTANIGLLGTASFTVTTPVTIPALGTNAVKVWVEETGDVDHTNDTMTTQANGVSFMPTKRLAFEEATGTWCGWCPRGAVYMDSMYKTYPTQTSLVAVHNSDPMTVTAYDNLLTSTSGFSGFPSVVVDRREIIDPSEIFDYYTAEKDYFGYADISFSDPVISGSTLTSTVTVKPAIDMSGDYSVSMVITEENVTGTASGYDQNNYYSSSSNNIALSGAGHNWQTESNPVPAASMEYDFVARSLTTSPTGSFPSTMTSGTDYTYNFTASLDGTWDVNNLRVVMLLVRNSDGQILNSNSTVWTTDVKQVANVEEVSLYPNPTRDNATITFKLTEKTDVQVQIVDVTGRVVSNVASQSMQAGSQKIDFSTASLPSGVYNVKIQTEAGSRVERLTVVK